MGESSQAGVSTGGSGRLPSFQPYLGCESSDDDDWRMIGRPRNMRRSSVSLLEQQPKMTPRMRSVILCWLMEVCETYAIHRQTFYLAQDYFDRFLLLEKNLKLGAMQLIVLTCLLIASKMEETRPLKIRHLSYVANGIYLVEEFRDMELVILKALRWYIRPDTALTWLKSFLQVLTAEDNSDPMEQQFPKDIYIKITNLLDLCILDVNSLDTPYHGLAASVLCHFVDQELVQQITGVPKDLLQPCVDWMLPFMEALEEFGSEPQKHFPTIKKEDQHNIQTKLDYMTVLDSAYKAVHGVSPKRDVNPLDVASYRQRIYVPGQGLTPPEYSS
ncbi:G1/S-specific cyclin-E1-like isoform X2 [Archocentrus centrarchus]|uniref:G1/S-specific cyclin-E1-like isoform X2 n=1 Tax=Archocentrus centrarchus TaxID=63155 RepID=UPI0011EA3514|nr:G1/S-specific cyclin-E1-like isoform X2 [Archocentrus centrarchus]